MAKLNRKEFSSLGYDEFDDIPTLFTQMRDLVAKQAVQNLIVTLAKGGALLVTDSGEEHAFMPPKHEIISHVGAGDSFMSALVYRLHAGESMLTAFRYGVAAASVTVQTKGNQLYDLQRLEAVYQKTQPFANS